MNKLNKSELDKRIAEYRKAYPGKVLYYTEDGNFFLSKSPAIDHANKTKQKWFELNDKEDAEARAKEEAEAKETLLKLDKMDDLDYEAAKAIVKTLAIETASMKKEAIYTALETYRKTLKERQ